jgi:hypothetical protein
LLHPLLAQLPEPLPQLHGLQVHGLHWQFFVMVLVMVSLLR